jgi:hypothetical protein
MFIYIYIIFLLFSTSHLSLAYWVSLQHYPVLFPNVSRHSLIYPLYPILWVRLKMGETLNWWPIMGHISKTILVCGVFSPESSVLPILCNFYPNILSNIIPIYLENISTYHLNIYIYIYMYVYSIYVCIRSHHSIYYIYIERENTNANIIKKQTYNINIYINLNGS